MYQTDCNKNHYLILSKQYCVFLNSIKDAMNANVSKDCSDIM